MAVAARRRVPIVYQVQDWWAMCARANLCDARRRLCTGPGPGKCARCAPLISGTLRRVPLLGPALHRYRAEWMKRALRHADAYIMGSRFILESYLAHGYLRREDPVHVIPYGVEVPATGAPPRPPRRAGAPLRFGVIGSVMPHKGMHLCAAAFTRIDPSLATLTLWGDPSIDPAYTRELRALCGPGTELRARFSDDEKPAIFAALDVLIVPSLGLESFGLVAREAMFHGVPVLASDRGALAELPAGAWFDPDDPGALGGWIGRLIREPGLVDRWVERLPAVKSADLHAGEIERVYDGLLGRRGARP
jgi:glycosyltransferase involved in cell wall biosynthesis